MKEEFTNATADTSSARTNGKWVSPGKSSVLQDQLIDAAKTFYKNFLEGASETMTKANKQTVSWVKEYPLQAAAGAAAVGFLLGAAIFRRRS